MVSGQRNACHDSSDHRHFYLQSKQYQLEVPALKNCKLCRYSRLCNDLPGVCVWIPYVAVAVVFVAMAYLFITQEMM